MRRPHDRPVRVIIAGSRSIGDYALTDAAMAQMAAGGPNRGRYEIVVGGADGVDQHGKKWAERYDCDYVEFDPSRPDNTRTDYSWEKHGKKAGPLRNQEMVEYADMLVAVWDGESSGTRDMIDRALDEGLEVYVSVID